MKGIRPRTAPGREDEGFRWCGPNEPDCGWPPVRSCRRCDATCEERLYLHAHQIPGRHPPYVPRPEPVENAPP